MKHVLRKVIESELRDATGRLADWLCCLLESHSERKKCLFLALTHDMRTFQKRRYTMRVRHAPFS